MRMKKKIDNSVLIQMVKDQVPQNEIIKEFGLKTSTQLKALYANALMETGMVPRLNKRRAAISRKQQPDSTIAVNKRGSLVIPKSIAGHFGLKPGDTFVSRRTRSGFSLRLKEGYSLNKSHVHL